jgi:hypothetical protein
VKLLINKLKLQKELDQQGLFLWGTFVLIVLARLYNNFTFSDFFSGLFGFILLSVYFIFFYRLLKNLYYSFWTILCVTIIWIVIQIFNQPLFTLSTFFYCCSLVLLGIGASQLWTPIYYPIVSWWEYDFRYRHDVKASVLFEGESLPSRLTDLRKGAGCVALFKEIKIGNFFQLELGEDLTFKVEVMSKRYYSLGRPLSYGVRFVLSSYDEQKKFNTYCSSWRKERKIKKMAKFEPV